MSAKVMLKTLADGVLQIRLNRPERMNALGFKMSQRLHEILQSASAMACCACSPRTTMPRTRRIRRAAAA